ncbi:prolyl-tRNA synthetase associated domain-containing protein [Salix suchowensis]|nr:prolyl-tRNA synthetase associated domain-containing protein [Salix suchowensis]
MSTSIGYTRLELQIDSSQFEHPTVLTVKAQIIFLSEIIFYIAGYFGDTGCGLCKKMFLKGKKSRIYIVSALVDTKVDMKDNLPFLFLLSQRLGLEKGGTRMAPEEVMGEMLQVSLGCATPFALINVSAQSTAFFHPISNDMSLVTLNACDLDTFLKSIGRDPTFANPTAGKDRHPDLVAFVPSGSTILPDQPEKAAALLQDPTENSIPVKKKLKANKPHTAAQNSKDKSVNAVSVFSDAGLFVEEILNKTSALLLSEGYFSTQITEDDVKKNGVNLGTVVADNIRKLLRSDLQSISLSYNTKSHHLVSRCITHALNSITESRTISSGRGGENGRPVINQLSCTISS